MILIDFSNSTDIHENFGHVLARSVHQPDLNQVDCHWSILSTPLKTYHLIFSNSVSTIT